MANAPFQIHFLSLYRRGGCFWGHVILSLHVSTPRPTRRLAQAFNSGDSTCHSRQKRLRRRRAGAWAVVLTPQTTAAGCSWVWVRFGLGIASLLLLRFCLVNCFACLLAALAWLAALVPFPVWVLWLNRIPRLLSVWFIASRGHHFALGTGGLKLSLLVGGLGPVYSLPKYCFIPFRNIYIYARGSFIMCMLSSGCHPNLPSPPRAEKSRRRDWICWPASTWRATRRRRRGSYPPKAHAENGQWTWQGEGRSWFLAGILASVLRNFCFSRFL